MRRELADFLDYCRLERRLAPLTCSAYERDVGACLAFLEREGIVTVGEVGPADLRRFLADEATRRPAPSSQARTVAALKCLRECGNYANLRVLQARSGDGAV
jgi:site-specific recombinase XerD